MLSIVRWKRHKISTCVVVKAVGYLHRDGCICEKNTKYSFGVIEGYVFKEGPYDAPWPENYRAKWKEIKHISLFLFPAYSWRCLRSLKQGGPHLIYLRESTYCTLKRARHHWGQVDL